MIMPLFGHRAMLRTLRALLAPFIVLFVVLTILSINKVHLGAHGFDESWQNMFAALAVIMSAGGYGWVMNANDFSRYLPYDASPRKIVTSVAIGGYIPSTLLSLLGAALFTIPAVAAANGGAAGTITGLTHVFSSWFFWPYLIIVIVQLFAINSIDLYSSGLTLQAIFPAIKRWQCVLLDTTVAGALTAYALFSSGFNNFITDFLLFMLIWIAPWVSIYLVDYFMRRGRYDSRALLDTGPGIYFRNGGDQLARAGRDGRRDGGRGLVAGRLPGVDQPTDQPHRRRRLQRVHGRAVRRGRVLAPEPTDGRGRGRRDRPAGRSRHAPARRRRETRGRLRSSLSPPAAVASRGLSPRPACRPPAATTVTGARAAPGRRGSCGAGGRAAQACA